MNKRDKLRGTIQVDRLRLGVIGAGRMGRSHCRVYANLRHAELIGVHDQSLHSGRAVAEANQVSFLNHWMGCSRP